MSSRDPRVLVGHRAHCDADQVCLQGLVVLTITGNRLVWLYSEVACVYQNMEPLLERVEKDR